MVDEVDEVDDLVSAWWVWSCETLALSRLAIVLELVGSLVRKRAVGVQCCGVSSCRYQSAR